jgi:hypothetical protein
MSAIVPTSGTWAAVKAHCDAEIASARRTLEIPGVGHPETEALRARIAALQGVLALARPPQQIATVTPFYG